MAKYIIKVNAKSDTVVNGSSFTKNIPFPTVEINGNMDNVANYISSMLLGIYNMNRINVTGVRYPKTTFAHKSNIDDIYTIGYGFVTVTNLYSESHIETKVYEFTAERIS